MLSYLLLGSSWIKLNKAICNGNVHGNILDGAHLLCLGSFLEQGLSTQLKKWQTRPAVMYTFQITLPYKQTISEISMAMYTINNDGITRSLTYLVIISHP